jgi:type II secretory pathway component PulJ
MSNDTLLLIVGGAISLFSVLAGALLQHWLEIRKMRTGLQYERQSELEREERTIERELLQEVGRISVRLTEEEWKRFVSELDPKDAAVFVAARLRARASGTDTIQKPDHSELQAVRYCLNCGAATRPGSKFCPTCGAKLDAVPE